jgi:hypothetical protein
VGYPPLDPEKRREIEERLAAERLANTPSARYRPDQDPYKPASMQPGSDMLAPFWIGFFVIVIFVLPVVIDWL